MTQLPFVIVYRVTDVVDVLAVMYGGRQYRGRLIPVAMMRISIKL